MIQRSNPTSGHLQLVEMKAMPNGGGSDRSLKKDIEEIKSGLYEVAALRPVKWEWKDGEEAEYPAFGFVAQEVEKILPQLVSSYTRKDGSESKLLSSQGMIPYLVSAIQEQQKQIEELRRKLG